MYEVNLKFYLPFLLPLNSYLNFHILTLILIEFFLRNFFENIKVMFLDIAFWILINSESKVYDFEKNIISATCEAHF